MNPSFERKMTIQRACTHVCGYKGTGNPIHMHAYVEMYIHFNARIFQLRNYDWNSTSAGYTIFTGNLTY